MANNSLRSFAAGIIVATSILTAVYYIQPAYTEPEKEQPLTESEVQHYLTEKGFVSIPKQQYDDLLTTKQSATNEQPNKTVDESTAETEEPVKKDTLAKEPEQPIAEHEPNQIITYTLEVKSGMNSIQISNLLEKEGIIKSGKNFEQYLQTKNWNRSVQVGTYTVTSDMSFEQIGRLITKNN